MSYMTQNKNINKLSRVRSTDCVILMSQCSMSHLSSGARKSDTEIAQEKHKVHVRQISKANYLFIIISSM